MEKGISDIGAVFRDWSQMNTLAEQETVYSRRAPIVLARIELRVIGLPSLSPEVILGKGREYLEGQFRRRIEKGPKSPRADFVYDNPDGTNAGYLLLTYGKPDRVEEYLNLLADRLVELDEFQKGRVSLGQLHFHDPFPSTSKHFLSAMTEVGVLPKRRV